jgi:hypothetical protein
MDTLLGWLAGRLDVTLAEVPFCLMAHASAGMGGGDLVNSQHGAC